MRNCLWKVSSFMVLERYCCHQKKKGAWNTCVGTKSPCHLLLCNTHVLFVLSQSENRCHQIRKDSLKWMNPFQMQAWEEQDFLLLESETDLSWTSLQSLSASSRALCWQRELLVALPVQSYFEFVILFLVFSPYHVNKTLQGWQLKALALASHLNSIRIAAGPRKVVEISEPFECSGCFYFLFVKLAEVR